MIFFCDNGDDGYVNVDGEYFVDGKPYPGFKEFYDIFKNIFNQIKYKEYGSDSDSDSDTEELDFPYTEIDFEDFFTMLNSTYDSDDSDDF